MYGIKPANANMSLIKNPAGWAGFSVFVTFVSVLFEVFRWVLRYFLLQFLGGTAACEKPLFQKSFLFLST